MLFTLHPTTRPQHSPGPLPSHRRPRLPHPFHTGRPRPIFPATITPDRTDTIATLTSKQRAHLRSLAHHLKPILQVGTDGVTEPVTDSIREALNNRELLKVKVHDTAPAEVDEAARQIATNIDGARIVQTIGRTIVVYRPFPEDPEIQLP